MMHSLDDSDLLRLYAEEHSEPAFAELVRRRLDFVYSCAFRRVGGDAHLAKDVAQQVFCALAREAGPLSQRALLGGWLYTTTRFVAAQVVRTERRRRTREQEAFIMNELTGDAKPQLEWERLRPVLDHTIDELDERDREAVVLRFFEGRTFADIGQRLRLTENAARMRVDRALDKLHGLLARRGVNSTSAALATLLANQAVVAAPAGLAVTITGAALTGSVVVQGAVSGSAAAGFMSMSKLHLGISSALAIAAASGYVMQANTNARLRDELITLRHDGSTLTSLQTENLQLMRTAAEVASMRQDDAELARLQSEAGGLRTRLQQLARIEEMRTAAKGTAAALDISRLDQTPSPRFQRRPEYPAEMRSAGLGGEVVVGFVVDANGDVQNVTALRSSRVEFEAAAIDAVSGWKFRPGKKGGREVASRMEVPIRFSLEGGNSWGGMTMIESAVPEKTFHVVATRPETNGSEPTRSAGGKQ